MLLIVGKTLTLEAIDVFTPVIEAAGKRVRFENKQGNFYKNCEIYYHPDGKHYCTLNMNSITKISESY